MPNDDFLLQFTTWLASVGQTYHIPAHLLYRWRRLQPGSRHKTWGLPDGDSFTDGAVVISCFEGREGLMSTALSNWEVAKPRPTPRKLSRAKKTKEPAPSEGRKKRSTSAIHIFDEI
jgi:hypothetical protein